MIFMYCMSMVCARSVSPAKRAADILKSGGVIAVPTDTIYGIAALVQSAAAVKKLYDIKVFYTCYGSWIM